MSSYEHMFTYLGHVYHSLASTWDKMLIDFMYLPRISGKTLYMEHQGTHKDRYQYPVH